MVDKPLASASEPPRKKRKLHLVKCDRCRIDKQKCLPVSRAWPEQRCDRCIEKEFPCSAGTLAGRKSPEPASSDEITSVVETIQSFSQLPSKSQASLSRKDAILAVETIARYLQEERRPAAGLPTDAVRVESLGTRYVPAEERSDRESPIDSREQRQGTAERGLQFKGSNCDTKPFPDYAFLLSYYYLLDAAMERLQYLEENAQGFFKLTIDKEIYVTLVDGTDRQKFDALVSKLRSIALYRACEVLKRPDPRQHSAGFSALMGKLLAQCPLTDGISCSLCSEAESDKSVLENHAHTSDIGSEFMIRQRRLVVHYQKSNHLLLHDINQEAVESEWFRYIELLFEIDARGGSLLTEFDILHIAPFLSKSLVVPLPEELGLQGDKLRLLRGQPDCLGRTELHFYLDSSTVEKMREEGLMQRALQSQLYDDADLLGRTPLHLACQKKNDFLVDELLRAGANHRNPTFLGHTPLHYAAASRSLSICRKLLGMDGIDTHWMDKLGNSPLFYAVQNQNEEMVELLLLEGKIDPDWSAAEQNSTPFLKAIEIGNEVIVRLLLRSGSDPNQAHSSSFEGYSALHYAIFYRRMNILKLLVNSPGVALNVQDKLGATPLCMAAEANLLEAIDYFTSLSGVDINARNYRTEDTALMVAAVRGHVETCRRLLDQAHIQVNLRNTTGETALIEAVRYGQLEVVRLLLQDSRVLVNAQDAEGRTALFEAVEQGRTEELCILLKHPAIDVNVRDKRRRTALIQAGRQDDHIVAKELLKHPDINVNIQVKDGRTALHEAARKGGLKTVATLLTHPTIDLNIGNNDGNTALADAILNGHEAIYRYILKHPKDDTDAQLQAD